MPPTLHLELPAVPGAAGRSRRATGCWLAALCGAPAPCDTAQDLVLAVSEAVSNSVEHAYRGDASGVVVLDGDVAGRRVRLTVSDRGGWRDPPADSGFRGRGLEMIEAVAEDVTVDRGTGGSTVTFHGTLGRCPQRCALAGRTVQPGRSWPGA